MKIYKNINELEIVGQLSANSLVNADCFEVFPFIEDKSIDAVICDLPYGTTKCKWDTVLDLDQLWIQYKRILKKNGVVILFAQTPFDKVLGCSNLKCLKVYSKEYWEHIFSAKGYNKFLGRRSGFGSRSASESF